ncbi:MAG: ATP-binding cassette domain-containing protein, partial [Lactobacillales bacterium]|nr:ATP-binding cassette domain-containing protein [Lactobacillales bacterium]
MKKHFLINSGFLGTKKEFLKAVDGVSFKLKKGETLAVVGESGCGKSTLGQIISGLVPEDGGEVVFDNTNFLKLTKNEFKEKIAEIQMIFQDPSESMDAHMTVNDIISEPLDIKKRSRKNKKIRVEELMKNVGLDINYKHRYPHELSGGQKQRVVIARALALSPKLVICDEPVSALDVSIRAQIINLLIELQKKLGISFIFISHDLSVVKYIADHVAVMYLGKIVEMASKNELYSNPKHPYTKALFSAVPIADVNHKNNPIILKDDIPNPINLPRGCRFHTGCTDFKTVC